MPTPRPLLFACVLLGATARCRPRPAVLRPHAPLVIARAECVGAPLIPTPAPDPRQLFPTVGAVTNADPALRASQVVRLPTRMRVRAVEHGYMVSWDPDSLTPVTIDVGCHMLTGSDSTYGISAPGTDPAQPARTLTGIDFGGAHGSGESLLPRPAGGSPAVVRAHITLFETDVPPQHEWMPANGRYRVLHERSFDTPLP